MFAFNESLIEKAAIEWLASAGWHVRGSAEITVSDRVEARVVTFGAVEALAGAHMASLQKA